MAFFFLLLITGDAWRAVYPNRDTRSAEQGISKGLLWRKCKYLWQRRALCVSYLFVSFILLGFAQIGGRKCHMFSYICHSFFNCLQLVRRQLGRLLAVLPSTSQGRLGWKVWRWQLVEQLVSWHGLASLWTREGRGWGSWRKELL